MLDVELFGFTPAGAGLSQADVRLLCIEAAASAGVQDGHVAIEFVGEQRIAELNAAHRGRSAPTDVLSFPIDAVAPLPAAGTPAPARGDGDGGRAPTRELGDVVICPARTHDLREAIVHGMLHLLGMDHEVDDGEMLALQQHLLRRAGR